MHEQAFETTRVYLGGGGGGGWVGEVSECQGSVSCESNPLNHFFQSQSGFIEYYGMLFHEIFLSPFGRGVSCTSLLFQQVMLFFHNTIFNFQLIAKYVCCKICLSYVTQQRHPHTFRTINYPVLEQNIKSIS